MATSSVVLPAKRPRKEASDASFVTSFGRLAAARDGAGLHALLRTQESAPSGGKRGAEIAGVDAVATDLERARLAAVGEERMELLCSALKRWSGRYIGDQDTARWMVLPLMWLCARPRRVAAELDQADGTDKHQRKIVEVLREQFQQLHRDRRKREGCLTVCCELLTLYYSLGQASQCSFLLAAVTQAHGNQKPDFDALPRGLAVTLCFLWGKHHLLEGNVVEAEDKLAWALAHCPPSAAGNQRRILTFLIPCRLRLGRFPKRELLLRHDLHAFEGLASAVADGDVRRFSKEMDSQEASLIRAGTFLVVEKLRLQAYRNLCRRVYSAVASDLDRAGRSEHRHKQDLKHYEIAFAWQDDFDSDETVCMLAHLIYIGAIRGYMSDEHQKIVFSKENAFPAIGSWSPKA